MSFIYEQINCQIPKNIQYINRDYVVVKAIFNNSGNHPTRIQEKAQNLAKSVNPHKANDSTSPRNRERLIVKVLKFAHHFLEMA